jgi:hypothetical protein
MDVWVGKRRGRHGTVNRGKNWEKRFKRVERGESQRVDPDNSVACKCASSALRRRARVPEPSIKVIGVNDCLLLEGSKATNDD